MSFSGALRSVNRHGVIYVCLALFAAVCVGAHVAAAFRVDACEGRFLLMNERTIRGMALIEFMRQNLWFPLLYGLLAVAGVLYLQIRGYPRWVPWLYAAILCLPCCWYLSVTAYIGGKVI